MTPGEERINAVERAICIAYEHSTVHKDKMNLLGGLLPREMAIAAITASDATRPKPKVTDAMIDILGKVIFGMYYDDEPTWSKLRKEAVREAFEAALEVME